MEQRTCNIIMCCKGNSKWNYVGPKEAVMRYLGRECDYPWKRYSDAMLREILEHAFVDFMRTTTKPSYVSYELFQALHRKGNIIDAILSTFGLLTVKNNDEDTGEWFYVNGFTESLIEQSKKDLH